jgi:hypothetical protein
MTEAILEVGEPHPAANDAFRYITQNMTGIIQESFASCALSGNKASEIAYSTWERLSRGEPVSDRYVLGLAWMLRDMKEEEHEDNTIGL